MHGRRGCGLPQPAGVDVMTIVAYATLQTLVLGTSPLKHSCIAFGEKGGHLLGNATSLYASMALPDHRQVVEGVGGWVNFFYIPRGCPSWWISFQVK